MSTRDDVAQFQVIRFGEFELDETAFELRRGGTRVAVQPRVFDLLRYLLIHRDHVVTKGELIAAVWQGTRVVDNAIARAVCEARRALGEGADAQSTIATVRGRGYRFVAAVAEAPAHSGVITTSGAGEPPLVGRDALLADLHARITHALGGAGGVALLAGEPGIGKTRLIEEIATRLAGPRVRVVVSRCYEGEGAPAFWPWTQLARELVARADEPASGTAPTDLAALFPGSRVASGAGPQARFELFDAVTTLVKRIAEHAPLLIAIDDLHWADDASLHLLVNAVGTLRRTRTMILGTLRTTGRVSPQLSAALGALGRIDPSSIVSVEGLRHDDIATFVRVSTGEALEAAEIERLAQATGGNPLFLKQLAHLRFKGSLPDGVVPAIVRHLEILSEPCRATLARASVLGRSFSATHLAQLCDDLSPDELADVLGESTRAGVVLRNGDALRFAHALVRDALYSFLSAVERGTLHARAARALVLRTSGRADVPLSTIAHHFLQAAGSGCLDESIEYAARAAEDALARFGYETAIELYERALSALDTRPDASRRRELLMQLGLARSRAGDHAGSRAAFEEAAGLARTLGMPLEMARAAFLSALATETGIPDAGRVELLEEALRAVGDTPTGPAALCTARLCEATWATYPEPRRRKLAERAVDIARTAKDADALAYALKALHYQLWKDADERELRERIVDELDTVAATGAASSEARVVALFTRLNDVVLAGDAAGTRAAIERYAHLATELRRPYHTWCVGMHRTMLALAEGRLADAETSFGASAMLAARAANEVRDVYGGVQLFMLRREQGRLGELEAVIRQLVAAFPVIASWPSGLAYMAVYYGDPEEARRLLLDRFGPDARPRPEINYAITLDLFAEVAVRLREKRTAKVIYDQLLAWAGLEIVIGPSMAVDGCASRMLGALAATLGHWNEAEAHFARAIEVDSHFGARPFVAYAHAAWAEALAERGHRGDAARAEEHAARAASIAREVGMPKLAERLAPFGGIAREAG